MTSTTSITGSVCVAIDIAKACHHVLVELPDGHRRTMRVVNSTAEIERLVGFLRSLRRPCTVAFEPTGDYHRAIMHVLGRAGFTLRQVSSVAVARTRDALFNSWDKNDPKDAQVILHLLKTGATQRFLDPLVTGHHDLQELANTYQQVSLRKVRLQHAIVTHHLPMYFPEAERYLHSSRAEWLTELLRFTPCPAAVLRHSKSDFIATVRDERAGRILAISRSRRSSSSIRPHRGIACVASSASPRLKATDLPYMCPISVGLSAGGPHYRCATELVPADPSTYDAREPTIEFSATTGAESEDQRAEHKRIKRSVSTFGQAMTLARSRRQRRDKRAEE